MDPDFQTREAIVTPKDQEAPDTAMKSGARPGVAFRPKF
jgi:hypothetical protein